MSNSREAAYRHAQHYETILRRLNSSYKRDGRTASGVLSKLTFEWNNIENGFQWAKENAPTDEAAAKLCSFYPNAGTYLLHLILPFPTRIHWLETGLDAARMTGDSALESFHLNNLGEAHYFAGNHLLARDYYRQAMAINLLLDDYRNLAQALANLGVVSAGLREYADARDYFEKALSIFIETGDRRGLATVYGDLGNTYKNEGNLDKALDFYQKRLEISCQIDERRSEAQALNSIGSIHKKKNDFKSAEKFYESALIIARRIGDRRLQSNALANLGSVRKLSGQIELALDSYRQQLNLSVEIDYRRGKALAYWNISLILYQLGDFSEAIINANEAADIYENLNNSLAEQIRGEIIKWSTQL